MSGPVDKHLSVLSTRSEKNTWAKKGLVFFQPAPTGKGLVFCLTRHQRQVGSDREYAEKDEEKLKSLEEEDLGSTVLKILFTFNQVVGIVN